MALKKIIYAYCVLLVVCQSALCVFPEAYIKNELIRFKKNNNIRGLAAAVYYDGKPYFINLGYANPRKNIKVTENTIFDIASISKTFTATLLALAVEKGQMKLDDPIADYLPLLRNQRSPLSRITLRQLATHTSSLPRKAPAKRGRKRGTLQSLLDWRPQSPIGTKFTYSNLGYQILGYTLENTFHMPYEALISKEITQPLGMNRTFVTLPPRLMPQYAQGFSKQNKAVPRRMRSKDSAPSGGLHSTTADLMKFMMANMGVYGPQGLQDAMKLAQKGTFRANPHMVQGLGWQNITFNDVEMIDKNGGLPGFSSWMGWVPKEKSPHAAPIGVILLSNTRSPKLTRAGRQLLMHLVRTYRPS